MKLSILFLFVSFCSLSQEPDTLRFYFDTDAYDAFELRPEDKVRLESLPEKISILAFLGHSDPRGSEKYNMDLSRKRMESVRKQLKNSGYDIAKASNEPMGESEAISSRLSLAECRRVDMIFIVPKEEEPPVEVVPIEELQTTGISKTKLQAFLEDEDAEELEFELTILFVNASVQALEESKPEMFRLLEIMRNNPNLNAMFHGHVCCTPHQEISEGRARTVVQFLKEYGIETERLDYIGHSNTQPKVWPEVTDEDRKQNRRVTVVFTKSDG